MKKTEKNNKINASSVRFVTTVSNRVADWIKSQASRKETSEAAFIREVLIEKLEQMEPRNS